MYSLLSFGAVAAVLAMAVAAGLGVVWTSTSIGEALSEPAARVAPARTGARCPHCGWIESKREVVPGVYEYTVRMRDGSSSMFTEALPATWREGQRLMVIN